MVKINTKVKTYIIHEDFPGANEWANDVCLIKVPDLEDDFVPACLPSRDFTHGEACFASGWGVIGMVVGANCDFLSFKHFSKLPFQDVSTMQTSGLDLREIGVNLMSHDYCIEHSRIKTQNSVMDKPRVFKNLRSDFV